MTAAMAAITKRPPRFWRGRRGGGQSTTRGGSLMFGKDGFPHGSPAEARLLGCYHEKTSPHMSLVRLHKTVGVRVGGVNGIQVGGGAPIAVQSMTMTDTADAAGTARQCV